jgi:phosphoglycolate phosphatase
MTELGKKDMIKMVAFDLDGTLCDSIAMCIEAFCEAVSPYAGHEITEKEVIETFGLNEIGMIKKIVKNNWEQALQDFYQYYEALHDMCPVPFPGIRDLINFLQENHIIVALITGKGEKSCDITLEKLRLKDAFIEIATGSEKKPNKAESILLLMQKYSVKSDEFYYIGDAVSDVTECKRVDVTCLSAAWAEFAHTEELRKVNPLHVFESISELKEFMYAAINP